MRKYYTYYIEHLRNWWMITLSFIIFHLSFSVALTSCETDSYDKGEGKYSQMQADFVVAGVGSDQRVDYVVTDEGDSLLAFPRFTTQSIEKADTTYRAILYYKLVNDDAGRAAVEAMGLSLVPTLTAHTPEEMDSLVGDMKTDPVKFESIWLARNRRFVNVSIILMTGQPDTDDVHQTLALMCDSVQHHADGRATACCRLYHDQGGVPEYYSLQRYLSIPVSSLAADTLRLSIQTYADPVVKSISLK